MSDDLVNCPSCGIDTPEGRFCKFCGKPLSEIEKPPVDDFAENAHFISKFWFCNRFDG